MGITTDQKYLLNKVFFDKPKPTKQYYIEWCGKVFKNTSSSAHGKWLYNNIKKAHAALIYKLYDVLYDTDRIYKDDVIIRDEHGWIDGELTIKNIDKFVTDLEKEGTIQYKEV